ncbi:hypothetical protein ACGFXC_10405 [Streptomyces sp. NPDC048507]|uniref:hypothetical protein n=1 Tax=Streptomyces sp. NPDC048507 TaxID=3365560 RepID=UPI003715253B
MAFDADAATKAVDTGSFEFTWKGELYEVPTSATLPTGGVRKISRALASGKTDVETIFDLLEGIWPEAAFTALMELPIKVVGEVVSAWMSERDTPDSEAEAEGKGS